MVYPADGEIYVPVCYRKEYDVTVGDKVRIGSENLTIAGFIRDSQMNSMMASSKRFLVSKNDYDRLFTLGSEEMDNTPVIWSIIYLSLKDEQLLNSWSAEYQSKFVAFGDEKADIRLRAWDGRFYN